MASPEVFFPMAAGGIVMLAAGRDTERPRVPVTWERFWKPADATVYIGFVLTALLLIGLCAYISFIVRVTLRDKRRRQRLSEITESVAYNTDQDEVTGITNFGYNKADDYPLQAFDVRL